MPPTLLRDTVYNAVKHDILTGDIAPGEQLQEATLAERFGISKTPVREALTRLVQDELLEVFPRLGYVATDSTPQGAHELLEYRALLESAAIELAARYITVTELLELETLTELDFRSHDRDSYKSFLVENRRFHLVIAAASRNRYLLDAISRLFDKVDRLLHHRLDVSDGDIELFRDEHRSVVVALRAHDPARARDALLVGLDRTREAAFAALVGRSSAPLGSHAPEPSLLPADSGAA